MKFFISLPTLLLLPPARILIVALVVGWMTLDASASDLPRATRALTALRRSQVFTTAYVDSAACRAMR
jgi:hypothetical protein